MSRLDTFELDVEAADGNGDAYNCSALEQMTVHLRPGITGTTPLSTLQLQGSVRTSGSTAADWINIGSAANGTSAYVSVTGAWARLRVATSSYASGTPTATVCGRNTRTS